MIYEQYDRKIGYRQRLYRLRRQNSLLLQGLSGGQPQKVDKDSVTANLTAYDPSGMSLSNQNGSDSYKYGGKELDTMNGLNQYDFGARRQDPALGIFTAPDPMAEKYPSISPYAYCAGNPINTIDIEGGLVIFINGMHSSSGGKSEYWGEFDNITMTHLNDKNAIYIDGSNGGSDNIKNNVNSMYRDAAGYFKGEEMAKYIINKISDNNGNIVETIKIITHSMGASYAKGFIRALINNFKIRGIPANTIQFEADFAPFQPKSQTANPNVPTFQFSHSNDFVANYGEIKGAIIIDTSADQKQSHRIQTFIDQIWSLPTGKYKIENGNIVPY